MSLHDDFYAVLSTAIDVPIIFANQNGKRPNKPFCTLTVTPTGKLPVHRGNVDDTGHQKLQAASTVEVSVQFFGILAWDMAEETAMRLHSDATISAAELYGVSFEPNHRILDVPELMDGTTYEPRCILELTAGYTMAYSDPVGIIDTVNGEGRTSGLHAEKPAPFTATVE